MTVRSGRSPAGPVRSPALSGSVGDQWRQPASANRVSYHLLDNMDVLASALNRVNTMVVKLTPLGVFAIAAATAGTMTVGEIGRLQAYLLLYSGMVVVLAFWVVPAIVEACTPFPARRVLSVSRSTLLTIFATGKIIVVLPQLIDNVKELFREAELGSEEVDSSAEVVMPLAYPSPNLGTIAIMVFIPFSAWFLGVVLSVGDWLVLAGAGVLSSFVAPVVGVPFLMNLLHIPSDMFQLFVMSTVYTDRVRVVLGAVSLFALTVMVTAALTGSFAIRRAKVLRAAVVTVILAVVGIVGIRAYLGLSFRDAYTADRALVEMHNLSRDSIQARTYLDRVPVPLPLDPSRSRLDLIRDRGLLRVGFLPDRL
ncbi:MAG: cation:dicarboxylase symporter family transporter, partial [Candidatus Sulfomarinibacteraceae bacterium]